MRIHPWFRPALATVLLGLSACGDGGTGVSVPRTPAASTMSLGENAFSFANFSAKRTTEEFNADDLVAMFGATEDVCTGGTEPCNPTPEAAAFARMVNQARASGHCEGLVALAAARFVDRVNPPTGTLQKDADVVHAILRAFATQFLPESQAETDGWAKKSLDEILAAISGELAKDVPEYTLNVYSPNGGHALLPLSVEFPDNDHAVLHVYDSNWPEKDRYVSFDLKNKEWSFSFSGKDQANDPKIWTGKKGDIDIASLTTRKNSTCPFCGDKDGVRNTMLVIRARDRNFALETDEGTISPDSPGTGETTLRPLAGPGAGPEDDQPVDYIASVPSTSRTLRVTAKSEARVTAVTAGSISEATTREGGSAAPIEITTNGISVDDPSVTLTLAAGDYVATSAGARNSLESTDSGVTATLNGANGSPVSVQTSADTPAIEVTGAGADGVPSGAEYVVKSQSAEGRVEETVVSTDGSTKTSAVEGTLGNTSTSANLSAPLAATDEVPGLPPETERAAVTETVTSTTTTVAPSGNSTGTNSSSGSTTKTTLKPRTTTTVAQKTAQRTAVSLGINLDNWSYGPTDPASSGFTATLTATNADSPTCSTAACLEGMFVDAVATGTDPATGRTITTTANFTMKNVAAAFSVRCGTKGSWVQATQSGASYSASCSIASVTGDDFIYLKA